MNHWCWRHDLLPLPPLGLYCPNPSYRRRKRIPRQARRYSHKEGQSQWRSGRLLTFSFGLLRMKEKDSSVSNELNHALSLHCSTPERGLAGHAELRCVKKRYWVFQKDFPWMEGRSTASEPWSQCPCDKSRRRVCLL